METRNIVTESVFITVSDQHLGRIRIEPWADEYEISPGKRYELRASSRLGFNGMEIHVRRQGLIAFANDGTLDLFLDGSPMPQVPGYKWD